MNCASVRSFCFESNRAIAQVAQDLGIPRRRCASGCAGRGRSRRQACLLQTDERDELKRLRKEKRS